MAPMVIADSDDEDDFNYSPQPQSPQGSSFGASSALNHVSHSESTDPAFFQNILDEQSAAARENNHGTGLRVMKQTGGHLPDAGFQAREDEADCSSITSTDPLQAGDEEDLRLEVSTSTRTVAKPKEGAVGKNGRRGLADDPWEIPSSPDEAGTVEAHRSRNNDSGRAKRKETKKKASKSGSNRPLQMSSRSHDEMDTRRPKKRKTNDEPVFGQDAEEVDLIQKPASQESDYKTRQFSPETMPPPTLPIERSSFIVALKTRRQVIEPESGDEPSQDQGPSKPEPGIGLAQSSGSATNINTPRSEPRSSRKIKSDSTQGVTRDYTNYDHDHETGQLTLSSSDVNNIKPQEVNGRKGKRKMDQESPVEMPEPEEVDEPEYLPVHEQKLAEDEDEESDFAEPAPKKKKQRGRPKKSADQKAKSKTKGSAANQDTSENPGTKSKKKRGRPRKSDQQAVENEHHPPEDGPSLEAAEAATTKAEDGAKTERGTSTTFGEAAIPDKDEKLKANESQIPVKVDVDKHSATETLENTVKQGNANQKQEEEAKQTPLKPTKSTTANSSSGKPLYRVGLSKKSRIAPLLKIVRK